MGLFNNFPWTNLHELNLQWIVETLKKCYSPDNPPEAMVISVNGESGEVILYKNAVIRFPDVQDIEWNIWRNTDGQANGIEFNKNNPAKRIQGTYRFAIYDEGNPPPYPVVSVNGETGTIELYTEAYIEFPDITENNWGIQRKLNADTVNETMVGIMLDDDGNLSVTKDETSIPVYTENNPPTFPVTSVNGMTGAVVINPLVSSVDGMTGAVQTWGYKNTSKIDIPIPSNTDDWSIGREIDQGGNLSIKIMYDDNIQKCTAYMIYNDGVNTPTAIKLLTNDDIPSSSGVVSFNGLTGALTITGAELKVNSNTTETINTAISNLNTAVTNLTNDDTILNNEVTNLKNQQSTLAVVIRNDTTPLTAIESNQLVYIIDSDLPNTPDGFYFANNAIASETTITANDIRELNVPGGVLNYFNRKINRRVSGVTSKSALETRITDICTSMDNADITFGYIIVGFADQTIGIAGAPGFVVYWKRASDSYGAIIFNANYIASDYYYGGAHHWYPFASV